MKFSLSLPVLRDEASRDPFAQTFELAQEAEQAGFDTATIGHHHFMPGNLSDPLTFLATVAARTSTLRVGTGIFQLPVHNPIRVAEQVATIDQISAGRISLGEPAERVERRIVAVREIPQPLHRGYAEAPQSVRHIAGRGSTSQKEPEGLANLGRALR